MKLLLLVLTLCGLAADRAVAFMPSAPSERHSLVTAKATLDPEALLERARKLKAEAAAAEQALHKNLLEKKETKDGELDACVDQLFDVNDDSLEGLVKRLKESHWSTDKLMQITKRIHEREISAQGKGHVTASLHHDHTKFQQVSAGNAKELARVQGMIDRLIEAAECIDEEYMAKKRKAKEQKYLSHVDQDHWTMGDLSGNLRRQVGELRREHEEQFQERLESFYEAQRKKDLPKPGQKDEHRP